MSTTTRAVLVHTPGGAESMKLETVPVGDPDAGQVRIKHTAIGLNYIDVYFRSGVYPAESPFTPGMEGAGVIEAVGAGVTDLKEGDRVAYAAAPVGAYAEIRLIAADRVVKVPDAIDDKTAAAMMLKGMTAWYLLRRTYPIKAGETILFHAAAGGVGLIACQWAKHLGVSVIGTVGSDEKAQLAGAHGCEHPVIYTKENFVDRVGEITNGQKVPVVYDSVGKSTFMQSLDCLQPHGMMVSFGQSSGKVEPLDIGLLSGKGSLYLTRPTLMTYTAKREDLLAATEALFDVVGSGAVKIEINQSYALSNIVQAHQDLESRKTVGSTVILPD